MSAIEHPSTEPGVPRESLGRLFLRFLKFGSLAWGGPVAQIAMIREELVVEEKWVTPEHFNTSPFHSRFPPIHKHLKHGARYNSDALQKWFQSIGPRVRVFTVSQFVIEVEPVYTSTRTAILGCTPEERFQLFLKVFTR